MLHRHPAEISGCQEIPTLIAPTICSPDRANAPGETLGVRAFWESSDAPELWDRGAESVDLE